MRRLGRARRTVRAEVVRRGFEGGEEGREVDRQRAGAAGDVDEEAGGRWSRSPSALSASSSNTNRLLDDLHHTLWLTGTRVSHAPGRM